MANSKQFYNKYKRNRERQLFYQSKAWAEARGLALKRDNFLCVQCLKTGTIKEADVVHHIIEVKDDFTKALELDNLESICHKHHNAVHKKRVEQRRKRVEVSPKIDVIISENNPEIF